jgi:hypothetical protein
MTLTEKLQEVTLPYGLETSSYVYRLSNPVIHNCTGIRYKLSTEKMKKSGHLHAKRSAAPPTPPPAIALPPICICNCLPVRLII